MKTVIAVLILFSSLSSVMADELRAETTKAVVSMARLLEARDFDELYRVHCHKHLRDQIEEEEFVADMVKKSGKPITVLMVSVRDAIKNQEGEEILIAGPQDEPGSYEFILVAAREDDDRATLWHIELKKEDGSWKLKDVD